MNKPSYVVTWCILMIGSGCAGTPVKTDALSSSAPKFTEFALRACVVASEKAGQGPKLYWEKTDQAKRLKELEKENVRLKKLVADLSLDNQILKEVTSGEL